jgi:ribonucleoside-diphosphate reductase alpha chain
MEEENLVAKTIYEELSAERKQLQEQNKMPDWFTTGGWQLFKERYLYDAANPRDQYKRIADTAAKYVEGKMPHPEGKLWSDVFFELLWKGWLSVSTPILANMGTNRGLPVSCSGQYIGDSIYDIYSSKLETAILTKHGFGTAGYFAIRERGAGISVGGKSSGTQPVFKGLVGDMQYVSQGGVRRGAFAAYIEIDHPDFFELCNFIEQNPEDANIGWIVPQNFIDKLNEEDEDCIERFQKALFTKMVTGKGYFFFKDKANKQRPKMYKDLSLKVEAPQLCNEIMLHSSPDYTYTCVLSSKNLSKYDEWKGTNSVYESTVFLDCVAEDFIQKGCKIKGLEKAVRFTKESRALGLGACGLHTLFQSRGIPFESFEAHMLNNEVFSYIKQESERASKDMAEYLGEPLWCEGYGVRNTHTRAVAPTKSTALIMGGISEGINPDPAMTYTQTTAAGEVDRLNPQLLKLMKDKRIYTKEHIQEVIDAKGSVQKVNWLSDEEKLVFKTAFEIDQKAILRLASLRQTTLDQGQSLNLFFSSDEDESYIAEVHQEAFEDPNINGLYYCYSKRGVEASKGECVACQ